MPVSDTQLDEFLGRHAPLAQVADAPGLRAHQAPDVFGLWHAWEELSGHTCSEAPFWAAAWPAARVLAAYLGREPSWVRGRRVLELGCGGAVAAIGAARAGASEVIANDIDPVARRVAQRNAVANGVALRLDAEDRTAGPFAPAEVILVADMFYERSVSQRLQAALSTIRATVLVADAGRPFAPAHPLRTLYIGKVEVDAELEGVSAREVRLMQLT